MLVPCFKLNVPYIYISLVFHFHLEIFRINQIVSGFTSSHRISDHSFDMELGIIIP